METSEEFSIYHCSFLPITSFLRNKSHLSKREISLYFLQGLEHTLKYKVQGQLQIEKLRNLADNLYTLEEISAAVIVILSWNCGEKPRIEELGPSIKKEHHDLSEINQSFLNGNSNISMLILEIIKQLNVQPAAAQVNEVSTSSASQQI